MIPNRFLRGAVAPLLVSLAVVACESSPPDPAASTEGFVSAANGQRLYYRIFGSGSDTLVGIHGFQGKNEGYLALDLAAAMPDRTLLFYDQRGGGRSDPVDGGELPGLHDHVADLEALRASFGIDRLALLGHSGGASIATQYALDHPERVDILILVAPGPPSPAFAEQTNSNFFARLDSATWADVREMNASLATAEDPAAVCEEIAAVLLPEAYLADPSAADRMRGGMCDAPAPVLRTEPQRAQAFQASVSGRDWTEDLGRIGRPALIVHGEEDAIPVAAAEAWVEHLPEGHLEILRDADHLPWLDRPEMFSDVVGRFLDR